MSLKIAVIGCGKMAGEYHGPAIAQYAATHPDTQLHACCDVVGRKATGFRDRFGFAHCETDYLYMLEKHAPDAVCLIVPDHLTCEMACQIMSRGFPVLLEKPPGRTIEELDRMIAVADSVHSLAQVAFNRHHMPLLAHLQGILRQQFSPSDIHHIQYDFVRWNRPDADFSVTAIHGIDAVGYLARSPYRTVQFHYSPLPHLGATVANVYLDCTFASGATAHLSFCPMAGAVIERATVHAQDHTFFLQLPVWDGFDSPGRLQHVHCEQLVTEILGTDLVPENAPFQTGGFYGEDAAFFDEVRAGGSGSDSLVAARQSVEIGQAMRDRAARYASNVGDQVAVST